MAGHWWCGGTSHAHHVGTTGSRHQTLHTGTSGLTPVSLVTRPVKIGHWSIPHMLACAKKRFYISRIGYLFTKTQFPNWHFAWPFPICHYWLQVVTLFSKCTKYVGLLTFVVIWFLDSYSKILQTYVVIMNNIGSKVGVHSHMYICKTFTLYV
jgi:hypothetical protein